MSTVPSIEPAEPADADGLRRWLNEPANMHAREALFMHRLCFDVQLAAARSGYYINTYYDDVDHDGFDIIFDDQDTVKKMQVKTADAHAPTQQWSVHKRMLRPAFDLVERLGFEPSPAGEGCGGGVIVMRFDAKTPDVQVEYLYTDVFVLLGFECGIIRRTDGRSQSAIERFLKDETLRNGIGSARITVPRAVFLRAKGPEELLALAGLHGPRDNTWQLHVIQIANETRPYAAPPMVLPLPLDQLKAVAASEIRNLVGDDDIAMATE